MKLPMTPCLAKNDFFLVLADTTLSLNKLFKWTSCSPFAEILCWKWICCAPLELKQSLSSLVPISIAKSAHDRSLLSCAHLCVPVAALPTLLKALEKTSLYFPPYFCSWYIDLDRWNVEKCYPESCCCELCIHQVVTKKGISGSFTKLKVRSYLLNSFIKIQIPKQL